MLGEGVEQNLLQLLPGHPVVHVGHLDVGAVGEGLGLGVGAGAAIGRRERGGAVGQAGGATPAAGGREGGWGVSQQEGVRRSNRQRRCTQKTVRGSFGEWKHSP